MQCSCIPGHSLRAMSWNARVLVAADPRLRERKLRRLSELAAGMALIVVQEVHGREAGADLAGYMLPPLPETLDRVEDDGAAGILALLSAAIDARSEVSHAASVAARVSRATVEHQSGERRFCGESAQLWASARGSQRRQQRERLRRDAECWPRTTRCRASCWPWAT